MALPALPALRLLPFQLALAIQILLVRGQIDRNLEGQHVLAAGHVPNLAGLDARDAFLNLKLKLRRRKLRTVARARASRLGSLRARHHLEQVLKVLHRVLLPAGAKLGVTLADDRLEHSRLDGGDGRVVAGARTLCVPIGDQTDGDLGHLGAKVAGGVRRGRLEDGVGARAVPLFVRGNFLEALEDGVHVARVAQVLEPDAPGAARLRQLRARLRDLIELEALVEVNLQLRHGLLRLLHAHDVDTPVREVLREFGIRHHVVLVGGVRVHVRAGGRDGAELDRERVLLTLRFTLLVVAQGAAVSTRAVPVFSAAADESVGEVEPQILRRASLGAPPRLGIGRDLAPLAGLLHQRVGVPRLAALLLPRGDLLLRVDTRVLEDRVDALRDGHRQIFARELHVDSGWVHPQEVGLDDVVVAVVVDVESALHADGELRGVPLRVQLLLRLLHPAPSLEQVERGRVAVLGAEAALHVDEVDADGPVRGEVSEETAGGERGVEAERALVLLDRRGTRGQRCPNDASEIRGAFLNRSRERARRETSPCRPYRTRSGSCTASWPRVSRRARTRPSWLVRCEHSCARLRMVRGRLAPGNW